MGTVPLIASLLVRDSYQFVFPDTFDSVGRLRERTEDNEVEPLIRSCPGGEDYCELPPSYPANKIARALHKIDNSLMRSLLNRTIDSAEIGAEISFRSRQSLLQLQGVHPAATSEEQGGTVYVHCQRRGGARGDRAEGDRQQVPGGGALLPPHGRGDDGVSAGARRAQAGGAGRGRPAAHHGHLPVPQRVQLLQAEHLLLNCPRYMLHLAMTELCYVKI